MSKANMSFGAAALEQVLDGATNYVERAIVAALGQFGKSGDLPKFGKDSAAESELAILQTGLKAAGKAEQTVKNIVGRYRKVLRCYPILEQVLVDAKEATLAHGKKKPRVSGIKNFREQEADRVLTVASRMVQDMKCKAVSDLPTPKAIVDAWVKKENSPKKGTTIHGVVRALRSLDNLRTSGKYQLVIDAAIAEADKQGIKWRKES